jgi:hypothetical protein
LTLRAGLRRLAALVESPADLWLVCGMAAWAAVLPLLKRAVPLRTLARIMWSGRRRESEFDAEKIVALSRLLTRRPPRGLERCYERSLLTYRFLSRCGVDPKLVTGVAKDGASTVGHAWVTVGGVPMGESEAVDDFVPLIVYGRGGLAEQP